MRLDGDTSSLAAAEAMSKDGEAASDAFRLLTFALDSCLPQHRSKQTHPFLRHHMTEWRCSGQKQAPVISGPRQVMLSAALMTSVRSTCMTTAVGKWVCHMYMQPAFRPVQSEEAACLCVTLRMTALDTEAI